MSKEEQTDEALLQSLRVIEARQTERLSTGWQYPFLLRNS